MYTKLVVQGNNHGDLRELWLHPCVPIWEYTPGCWAAVGKEAEENNHVSEAVLCANFKHWMPLYISREAHKRQNTNHN